MTTIDAQINKFKAISKISAVKTGIRGMFEKSKQDEHVDEFETAGYIDLLNQAIDIIKDLSA